MCTDANKTITLNFPINNAQRIQRDVTTLQNKPLHTVAKSQQLLRDLSQIGMHRQLVNGPSVAFASQNSIYELVQSYLGQRHARTVSCPGNTPNNFAHKSAHSCLALAMAMRARGHGPQKHARLLHHHHCLGCGTKPFLHGHLPRAPKLVKIKHEQQTGPERV